MFVPVWVACERFGANGALVRLGARVDVQMLFQMISFYEAFVAESAFM